MFDQTSFKLISGFLGLLILGFLVFIIASTSHVNDLSTDDAGGEISSIQIK